MTDLTRGASDAPVRILLAHGAGAGMEHNFLAELSRLLAGPEIEVVRFQLPLYDQTGSGRQTQAAGQTTRAAGSLARDGAPVCPSRLFLAGKSMGGGWRPSYFARGATR